MSSDERPNPASGAESDLIVVDLLAPTEAEGGATAVHHDAEQRVTLLHLAPGGGLPNHRARSPVVLQIVEGEAEIVVGERSISARPGLWIRIAAGLEHSVRSSGGARLLLQLLVAP